MADERQSGRESRAQGILEQYGGLEALLSEPASERSGTALELLVLNELDSFGSWGGLPTGADGEARFVRRVCGKLRFDLRQLSELRCEDAQKVRYLLRGIRSQCKRVLGEFGRQRLEPRARLVDSQYLMKLAGSVPAGVEPEGQVPGWYWRVQGRLPGPLARLAALLAAYVGERDTVDDLVRSDGRIDVGALSDTFGCSRGEVRRLLAVLREESVKVKPRVPRPFLDIHRRLSQLAASSFDGLADVELRERLFNISRALAYAFGPEDAVASGVQQLDKIEFDAAIDLLLEERQMSELSAQRDILERLMQRALKTCAALESADMDGAFKDSALLVLDVARIQHHTSPARLQVLLCYSYFLWLGRWYEAFIQTNRAICERCEALVRSKGESEYDRAPEIPQAETLRRVRTFALVNEISCLFNHVHTTARSERFVVRDYGAVEPLAGRLRELLAFDPGATTVLEELLVVQAHLVRAAYNVGRKVAADERERWRLERERQRGALRDLIEAHFSDPKRGVPDVQRLLDASQVGEGCAVGRTLDVIEEALRSRPDVLHTFRAERLALAHRDLEPE